MSEQVALVLSHSESQLIKLIEEIIKILNEDCSRIDVVMYAENGLEQIKLELTEGVKL